MSQYIAATFALFIVAGAPVVHAGGKQGVTVSSRQDGRTIELEAEGEINAPPSRVRDVVLDYPSQPRYVRTVTESRVLAKTAGDMIVYQRLKLPALHDRDVTLRVTSLSTGTAITTRFQDDGTRGPQPISGVVRLPKLEGGWDLEPIRDGAATRARYHVRIDLGGSVPTWMVRSGAARDIPRLFEGIRSQVRSCAC